MEQFESAQTTVQYDSTNVVKQDHQFFKLFDSQIITMRGTPIRHDCRNIMLPPTCVMDLHEEELLDSDNHHHHHHHHQDIGRGIEPRGITSFSNKKCAHSLTHDCPYLADSNSSLCTACSIAVANGQPCV
ncbi:hypothetical protein PT974_10467 [Cladobotryum mycophilum]|uniref:Uncharacterized protein n=1 Tax=Cladobotryum mycophilum TaxID=491253 RepID=A0ABR0SAH1_9HYPO